MITKCSEKQFLRDAQNDGFDTATALAAYEKYKAALTGFPLAIHHEDLARHAANGFLLGGSDLAVDQFVSEIERGAPIDRKQRTAMISAVRRVQ